MNTREIRDAIKRVEWLGSVSANRDYNNLIKTESAAVITLREAARELLKQREDEERKVAEEHVRRILLDPKNRLPINSDWSIFANKNDENFGVVGPNHDYRVILEEVD